MAQNMKQVVKRMEVFVIMKAGAFFKCVYLFMAMYGLNISDFMRSNTYDVSKQNIFCRVTRVM